MAYFKIEDLHQKTGSLYKLVVLAAKRALEISKGAEKLVETESDDPSTIALQEIKSGKVKIKEEKKKVRGKKK